MMHQPTPARETEYLQLGFEARPKPNQMLLWPSYLEHMVPRQETSERITVSFNVDIENST